MPPVHKLSAMGSLTTNKIDYPSMLAGNAAFVGTSYESIATVTGNGSSSSITFSSIPSTYQHLQIRAIAREASGGNVFGNISVSANGDTGANYTLHQLYGDGTSALAAGSGFSNASALINIAGNSAAASVFGGGVVDILDYTNTNKLKTFRSLSGTDNSTGGGFILLRSQLWNNLTSINSLTLTDASGVAFTSTSSFALYGIKG
jgi:hypothetical protein